MTIGKKLLFASMLLFACVLALSYAALSTGSKLGQALDSSINVTAREIDLVGAMRARLIELSASIRGEQLSYLNNDAAAAQRNNHKFNAAATRIREQIRELQPLMRTSAQRQAVGKIETGVSDLLPFAEQYQEAAKEKDMAKAHAIMTGKIYPIGDELETTAAALTSDFSDQLAVLHTQSQSVISYQRWLTFVLIVLSLLAGAGTLWVIAQTNRGLRQVAAEMAQGAEQLASAAQQVSASSQSLAQGASEQAASLEETSATTEEITSMAGRNAENSRAAAGVVASSGEKFVAANRVLDQTVATMNDINTSSSRISKIIKVIDDIAFQTNILALNAAVEAARAGDAGSGFAVVADEVRNLAQRSATAAKDTASLIEESISKSGEGKARVDEVTTAIQAISTEAMRVDTLVDEVRLASEEQARGLDQMAKAIAQMEQVTQKTAANAEESASAGEEMASQADALRILAHRLREMVGQDRAASRFAGAGVDVRRHAAAVPSRPAAPGHGSESF